MGLASIGSITIQHGDPDFTWTSSPTAHGIRAASISGSCTWLQADQLSELAANPATTTIGGQTGVKVWVVFDDALLASKTGYYLLKSFDQKATQKSSLASSDVNFSLSAAFVGDLAS
jgi:hypothetical protein